MIFHFNLFLLHGSPDTHYTQLPHALSWQLHVSADSDVGDETGTTRSYDLGIRYKSDPGGSDIVQSSRAVSHQLHIMSCLKNGLVVDFATSVEQHTSDP